MKWGKPQRENNPVTNRLRMYAQEKATQGGTQLNVTNPFKPLRPLRFGANVFP
jgi:hypothetical protein